MKKIGSKISTHVTIDYELKLKAKQLNINISEITNNVLKGIIASHDMDSDLIEIRLEIDEIRNKMADLKIREQELISQQLAIEHRDEEQLKQEVEKGEKMIDAIRASGGLE